MNIIEKIRDVFALLHDGSISEWIGDNDKLILTIDCEYLAERIDTSFNKFYVELNKIAKIELQPWPNPIHLPAITKTNLSEIFAAELELLNTEIKENYVIISCNQSDILFDYCGGNLLISCKSIEIYDQTKNIVTIEDLERISKAYWDEWSSNQGRH